MKMTIERQNEVLAMLKETYLAYGKGKETYNLCVYRDFYWQEIETLAVLYPQYVANIPPVGRNMWLAGSNEVKAAISNWQAPEDDYVAMLQFAGWV